MLDKNTSGKKPKWITEDKNTFPTRKAAVDHIRNITARRLGSKADPQYNKAIKEIEVKRKRIRRVTIGDDADGVSGRFAVLKGVDFVELDTAYDKSYGLLLNRSKVLVQSTRASSIKP